MSLTRQAADLVIERGAATVDDLMPELPDYTRAQVMRALRHAADLRLIACDGITPSRGVGNGTGSKPSTYRAIRRRAAVASVWDMASAVSMSAL